jgi:hypothetical protein
VALRPRLWPGVPSSMGGWPEIRCGTGVVKSSGPACWLGRPELHVTAHAAMQTLVTLEQLAEVPMREGRFMAGQFAARAVLGLPLARLILS